MFIIKEGNRKHGINYQIWQGNLLVRVGNRVVAERCHPNRVPKTQHSAETLEQAIELAEGLPNNDPNVRWYDGEELREYVVHQLGCTTDLQLKERLMTKRGKDRAIKGYYFTWCKELLFVPSITDCLVYIESNGAIKDYLYTFLWNRNGFKCR